MRDLEVDILIAGGGLIGATLMLALRPLGLRVLLVEANSLQQNSNPDFDARSLALAPASQRILQHLGLWDLFEEVTPIDKIHVSDQQRFGAVRLQAKADNPLGYVVEMHAIQAALHQLLQNEEVLAPARLTSLDLQQHTAILTTAHESLQIKAQLIVAADGAESALRQMSQLPLTIKNYQQQAIVANIGLGQAHEYKAFERFTPQGPLALLPMTGQRMSLVWSMDPKQAEAYMLLEEEDFLKVLQKAFGFRLGRFLKAGKRHSYPLKQVLMPKQAKWPLVFLGNAAHSLHPVAGQGFNLGLRDAATLAQCIQQQGLNEAMLQSYLDLRKGDQKIIIGLTNGLINLFGSPFPGLQLARTLGLLALDNSSILKNCLTHYASGFGGFIPDLVCEQVLT